MDMENEPTSTELRAAFNNCCLSSAFNEDSYGKPAAQQFKRLLDLRRAKQTWMGTEEHFLRADIDRYIRENT